jgi:hypothetical protein
VSRQLGRKAALLICKTGERRREERRKQPAAHPEQQRIRPPPSLSSFGPLRDPWPDGPRARIVNQFQEACLDTGAFSALVRAKPDTALEVLLAVCIEEPQHEDYSIRSRPECGVEHWRSGDPPLFCRGPFLQFLRQAPEQGLSFPSQAGQFRHPPFCWRRVAGRRRQQRLAHVVRR